VVKTKSLQIKGKEAGNGQLLVRKKTRREAGRQTTKQQTTIPTEKFH
jgi:hypothetical protein